MGVKRLRHDVQYSLLSSAAKVKNTRSYTPPILLRGLDQGLHLFSRCYKTGVGRVA